MQNDISKKNWFLIWVFGPSLFLVSAAVTALSILPLIAASRLHRRRLSEYAATKLEAL